MGRRARTARQPRSARRLARRRHAAPCHHLQPRMHHARPAGRRERSGRPRPAGGGAARPPRAGLPRDPGERTAPLRARGRGPGLRPPLRRHHVARAACAPPPPVGRMSASAANWWSLRACSRCSTCATSPRTPTAGTRPRSTRARRPGRASSSARQAAARSARSAPSGRASAGRFCRRWSRPMTRRGCCWRGNSRSRRSASSWTCGSRAGCARCGDGLSRELRREWSGLRELGKDELMLRAIEQLIELEKLRGSRGA